MKSVTITEEMYKKLSLMTIQEVADCLDGLVNYAFGDKTFDGYDTYGVNESLVKLFVTYCEELGAFSDER